MIKGSMHTIKSRKKMSKSLMGRGSWNAGLKGYTNTGSFQVGHGSINPPIGVDSPHWKGEQVGYSALHKWVKKNLGSSTSCELCPKTNLTGRSIGWANISGLYKRDLGDWMRLCKSCHYRFDRRERSYKANDVFAMQGRFR